jgi:hypothetical protein
MPITISQLPKMYFYTLVKVDEKWTEDDLGSPHAPVPGHTKCKCLGTGELDLDTLQQFFAIVFKTDVKVDIYDRAEGDPIVTFTRSRFGTFAGTP